MPTTTIEEAAITSTTALVMGHGGGSDCLVASLVADWLHRIGVPRTILGGIACQWWMPVGEQRTWLNTTVGPDFYDPTQLTAVTQIGESCVIVTAESALDGRQPHEAIAARHFGGESFLISLRQGGCRCGSRDARRCRALRRRPVDQCRRRFGHTVHGPGDPSDADIAR